MTVTEAERVTTPKNLVAVDLLNHPSPLPNIVAIPEIAVLLVATVHPVLLILPIDLLTPAGTVPVIEFAIDSLIGRCRTHATLRSLPLLPGLIHRDLERTIFATTTGIPATSPSAAHPPHRFLANVLAAQVLHSEPLNRKSLDGIGVLQG